MTSTQLIRSTVAAYCLLLPMLVQSQEPRGDSEVRRSHPDLIDAEMSVKEHELELKMSELAVAEAKIEFQKLKLQLQAAKSRGDSYEVGHVEHELEQAAIRVELRSVQSEMAQLRIERARAAWEHKRTTLQDKDSASKRRQENSEREVALEQLKTMHIAMQGLQAAGREDFAELVHRAIRSQEVTLEGRRDAEAREIRESAPTPGQRVELLMFAAGKLRESGKTDRAQVVDNLAKQLRERFRNRRERDSERDSELAERGPEARLAAEEIEVMQTALIALREGERRDAAELLKRAIQARQVRLRRLKGAEAETVLEREPAPGKTIEALALASSLWRKFGNEKNAVTVEQLAERWAGRDRGTDRARELRDTDARLRQRKRFEDELAELQAVIERASARVEELRRELRE